MRVPILPVAVALALLGAACGAAQEAADPPTPPPGRLVGEIVEVRSEGRRVSAFTLDAEGERWEIAIADDVDYGFDLDHLYEHRDTGDPVDVRLEERDGALVALQIDDA